jgi:hypothetical protein
MLSSSRVSVDEDSMTDSLAKTRKRDAAVAHYAAMSLRQKDEEGAEDDDAQGKQQPENASESPYAVQSTSDDRTKRLARHTAGVSNMSYFLWPYGIRCTYCIPAFAPMDPPRSFEDVMSAMTPVLMLMEAADPAACRPRRTISIG